MKPRPSAPPGFFHALLSSAGVIVLVILFAPAAPMEASSHYTAKQLDALATRVGKTFWVMAVNNRTPLFLSAAAPDASSFRAQANESFEIKELVGQKSKNPYYKVKFDSGKDGYIRPETFLEEFNLTILTLDPQADEKKKAAREAEEENKRLEWIQAQPWPQAVKQAAIKRQVVPGLTTAEVKHILGDPARVIHVKGQRLAEEHWHYVDGSVLIFQNRLLHRIGPSQKQER